MGFFTREIDRARDFLLYQKDCHITREITKSVTKTIKTKKVYIYIFFFHFFSSPSFNIQYYFEEGVFFGATEKLRIRIKRDAQEVILSVRVSRTLSNIVLFQQGCEGSTGVEHFY